tara:strand:- start:1185 stop:1727 length:543 start_codon:yes stop_codon:yes gene_type:complete
MSKSTFFIRDTVRALNDEVRKMTEIDLGAYVNLGSTKPQVLRIHSIQVQFADDNGGVPNVKAESQAGEFNSAFACVSLTTKETLLTTPYMPMLNEDETVFTAAVVSSNGNSVNDQGIQSSATDLAPQHLVNGYLIGVPSLYLYGRADDAWNEEVNINILMECSVETVTRENAVNLALSQA